MRPAALLLVGLKVAASGGLTMIKCWDEMEATLALFLIHSVLNFKFSHGMEAFMDFIQRYVLAWR